MGTFTLRFWYSWKNVTIDVNNNRIIFKDATAKGHVKCHSAKWKPLFLINMNDQVFPPSGVPSSSISHELETPLWPHKECLIFLIFKKLFPIPSFHGMTRLLLVCRMFFHFLHTTVHSLLLNPYKHFSLKNSQQYSTSTSYFCFVLLWGYFDI